jgi:hypothetical protein
MQMPIELGQQCELASRLWGRLFSALTLVVLREGGDGAFGQIWHRILGGQQIDRYKEGLVKLGIEADSPAIRAAKYHYFSNMVGGLKMEYVEETPRKVWIRYTAPLWMYEGLALLALPKNFRRTTTFAIWHPRNGEMMGCPRLGYVGTKFIDEGAPYDEGYFIEYDHDLTESERYRREVVVRTPKFVPAAAPTLDPAIWPKDRLAKAKRKYSAQYVKVTVAEMLKMFGLARTCFYLEEAAQCLAAQYAHEIVSLTGSLDGGFASTAGMILQVLDAFEQKYQIVTSDNTNLSIAVSQLRPFDDPPEQIRVAYFQLFQSLVRVLNGNFRCTIDVGRDADIWRITDTGQWLW